METTSTDNYVARNPGVFVIPFYGDQTRSPDYLNECIEALFEQTDPNWQAVIVDDASPGEANRRCLQNLEHEYPTKITVIHQTHNIGQGRCRNIAIQWAQARGYPIALYNDADDLSHPERLSVVRELFLTNPSVDLVYSDFQVIDENGEPIPRDQLVPGVSEIIDAIHTHKVEGYNAWITIGTVTGFVCLPSATSVRTCVAHACPFPDKRVSEDSYTWMNISAHGSAFKFTPLIPSRYRIPSYTNGSSYRARIGKKAFYEEKTKVDIEGFMNAIRVSLEKGLLSPQQVEPLKMQFLEKLAETLRNDCEFTLAESLLARDDSQASFLP